VNTGLLGILQVHSETITDRPSIFTRDPGATGIEDKVHQGSVEVIAIDRVEKPAPN
jgi:hypothetical protein